MMMDPVLKKSGALSVALSIVVPVYKEAGNIKPFLRRTEAVMEKLGLRYEIIFANEITKNNKFTINGNLIH